jgi:hypothetical protein
MSDQPTPEQEKSIEETKLQDKLAKEQEEKEQAALPYT